VRQQTTAVQAEDGRSAGGVCRFGAIGTDGQIDTEHPLPDRVRQQITALTENLDWVWSRFRADSLVTQIG
jgi:thiamine biosynthesis lipoprotein